MTTLVSYVKDHGQTITTIAGALWTIVSVINGAVKNPEAKSWLGKLLDGLSYIKRADAPGSVKLPFAMSMPKKVVAGASGTLPPPPSAAALLPLILVPLLALTGCTQCKLPANANTPVCVLQSNIVSCGEQDALALLPIVMGIVGELVAGQPFDPNALVTMLESQGAKDAPCIVAAIQNYFTVKNPIAAAKFHESLKIALAKKGKHGSVEVKLRRGSSINAVVP
jgi:hypothetical protein